ncbi:Maf family protein [Congregibacter variabilis]|uniref:dTTP/UTP pyrophosphatase n=1 Tax=Congregibacter variabilis TaxID=3081200 RepID=A0ABZ0I7H0_9GAMM|nr:Maf family protein [Congregibacter sp. IMCC43200]
MESNLPALVLGSASPRRADLLAQLGLKFQVTAADIDETPQLDEAPRSYVQRMAEEKADALADLGSSLLLTADTTVVLDEVSLGKPQDAAQARQMLERLSDRSHEVYTAVCARQGLCSETVLVRTLVEFAPLTPALIDAYLSTDEPWDKAGAYAIQGLAGSFVRRIDGSVSNVIGLPLVETRELLADFGLVAGLRGGRA